MGLPFQSKLGLAAGLDKNGTCINFFRSRGFGFIEVGTVTPKGQKGNPKPRLFRVKPLQAIINKMGFNNQGMEQVYKNVKKSDRKSCIIGINIGKNKSTTNEKAHEDYLLCFDKFFEVADYFTVNVSSPNTQGLRNLQSKKALKEILGKLEEANQIRSKENDLKPIFIKIAPDLDTDELDNIISIVNDSSITGIIATNTTIDKSSLGKNAKSHLIEGGGLSGKPLGKKSTFIIKYIKTKLKSEKIIIGVGGIFSGKDAVEKIEAGADLVQVYTGLVYKGLGLIKEIQHYIDKKNTG